MRISRLCLVILLVAMASLIGWLAVRQIIISAAEHRAGTVIKNVLPNQSASDDEIIKTLTTYVFLNFDHARPGEVPSLHRLRPFVTNHRLPRWLRLPDGLIESYTMHGHCDDAARALSFILKQKGYHSYQWDMVQFDGAHSALEVTTSEGRRIFADPFYGFVAQSGDGTLIDADTARTQIQNGIPVESTFLALGADSNWLFYKSFDQTRMNVKGKPLRLESTLPPLNNEKLVFGEIDGSDQDVMNASDHYKLTPYWHYIGHKYNRGWVRVLKTEEPVRIEMTLVDPPEPRILNATPAPSIKDKTLTWLLKPGENITLKDGNARLSLKRLNSYIGIDQIVVSPDSP